MSTPFDGRILLHPEASSGGSSGGGDGGGSGAASAPAAPAAAPAAEPSAPSEPTSTPDPTTAPAATTTGADTGGEPPAETSPEDAILGIIEANETAQPQATDQGAAEAEGADAPMVSDEDLKRYAAAIFAPAAPAADPAAAAPETPATPPAAAPKAEPKVEPKAEAKPAAAPKSILPEKFIEDFVEEFGESGKPFAAAVQNLAETTAALQARVEELQGGGNAATTIATLEHQVKAQASFQLNTLPFLDAVASIENLDPRLESIGTLRNDIYALAMLPADQSAAALQTLPTEKREAIEMLWALDTIAGRIQKEKKAEGVTLTGPQALEAANRLISKGRQPQSTNKKNAPTTEAQVIEKMRAQDAKRSPQSAARTTRVQTAPVIKDTDTGPDVILKTIEAGAARARR